jgi:hypothetical protein
MDCDLSKRGTARPLANRWVLVIEKSFRILTLQDLSDETYHPFIRSLE